MAFGRLLLVGRLGPLLVAGSDAPGTAGSVDNCRSGTFFVGVGFGVVAAAVVCLVTVVVGFNEGGRASREGLTEPSPCSAAFFPFTSATALSSLSLTRTLFFSLTAPVSL